LIVFTLQLGVVVILKVFASSIVNRLLSSFIVGLISKVKLLWVMMLFEALKNVKVTSHLPLSVSLKNVVVFILFNV